MKIPFLNLERSNDSSKAQLITSLSQDKINWILGDEVRNFENEWSRFMGIKYSVGVSNGLDGLELAMQALILDGRLKKGDKILLQANAYYACILAIINAGLTPILYDIDSDQSSLDLNRLNLTGISGIMLVHMYGKSFCSSADYIRLQEEGLIIIEDCSQAHGLKIDGHRVGSLADTSVWSMYPTKNLGALGDAGMVSTGIESISNILKMLRNYGKNSGQEFRHIGRNARLDTIQAIFLSHKLPLLDELNSERLQIASEYSKRIDNSRVNNISGNWLGNSVYHLYIVMVDNRSRFMSYLESRDIQTQIHYEFELCNQMALKDLNLPSMPNARKIANEVVSLPIWPGMTEEYVSYVIDAINSYE